jgi:hypothetical protein
LRTPLTVWFAAAWYVTSQKHGTSALGLQRTLGLGSYQTAWTLMHRFRRAMVRPNRERLQGTVEIDEAYVARGDREVPFVPKSLSGKRETGQLSVVMAAEVLSPKGIGRIRLRRIPAAAREYVEPFIRECVDRSALIQTDGSLLYAFLDHEGYRHRRTIVQDLAGRRLGSLPAVNRVASLLKRWLLGTHHGAVQPRQLDHYLDEFVFRFNRRSIELDVVASLDDGRTLLGEIKWSSRAVGPELHAQVQRNVEDLARSGQRWAHDAMRTDGAAYIYYSAAGFTPSFEALARQDSRIRLISLRDMYRR